MSPHAPRTPSPADVLDRRWSILAVLCTSLTIVMIGNTSLNVALPDMAADLGLSNADQQWAIDAYSLVFAGLLFTAGSLGDRWGRKKFLQAGIVVFGLASAYAAIWVDSSAELIFSRGLMGIGGALVMPATLSILVNSFPAEERGKAIAIWTGIAGGTGAVGLLLGGWLIEHYSWSATFLMNVPVAALALLVGFRIVPESRDPNPGKLDPAGAVLSFVGLTLMVYGLIEGAHWGWTDPKTFATVVGGIAVLAAFALWELRIDSPMLEVRLFQNRAFTVSSIGITLVFLVMFGFFFVVSQLFQLVFGYGAFESGLRLLPIMPLMVTFTPLSAVAVKRYGVRPVVIGGMTVTSAGVLFLGQLDGSSGYLFILAGMAIMACGMAFTMTPMTTLIMASVPPENAGMGSAMNDTTRELGTTLGVAIPGSILASGYAAKFGDAAEGLPPAAQEIASSSLAGARMVAQEAGAAGEAMYAAAKEAWIYGLQQSLTISAFIILAAALFTYLFLPKVPADVALDDTDSEELMPEELADR